MRGNTSVDARIKVFFVPRTHSSNTPGLHRAATTTLSARQTTTRHPSYPLLHFGYDPAPRDHDRPSIVKGTRSETTFRGSRSISTLLASSIVDAAIFR